MARRCVLETALLLFVLGGGGGGAGALLGLAIAAGLLFITGGVGGVILIAGLGVLTLGLLLLGGCGVGTVLTTFTFLFLRTTGFGFGGITRLLRFTLLSTLLVLLGVFFLLEGGLVFFGPPNLPLLLLRAIINILLYYNL